MDRITFFEFTTSEPAKENAFFTEVFGWQISQWGEQQYWLATTGPADKPGIDGAISPPSMPDAPRVVTTISVDNLDDTLERATGAGAKIMVPKAEVPGFGWLAYLVSPTGIPFGVIQQIPGATM